jgi:hypothetical protein
MSKLRLSLATYALCVHLVRELADLQYILLYTFPLLPLPLPPSIHVFERVRRVDRTLAYYYTNLCQAIQLLDKAALREVFTF